MNTFFSSSYDIKTNSNGELKRRVFKGDYTLSVSYKNQFKSVKRTITENNTLSITLE